MDFTYQPIKMFAHLYKIQRSVVKFSLTAHWYIFGIEISLHNVEILKLHMVAYFHMQRRVLFENVAAVLGLISSSVMSTYSKTHYQCSVIKLSSAVSNTHLHIIVVVVIWFLFYFTGSTSEISKKKKKKQQYALRHPRCIISAL